MLKNQEFCVKIKKLWYNKCEKGINMKKERLKQILEGLNIKVLDSDLEKYILEYTDSLKSESEIVLEIIEKIKSKNKTDLDIINNLISFNIGKTSLNYFLNPNIIRNILNNKKEYQQNYNYLKENFLDALNKSINIVVENEQINKISVNDTIIRDYIKLFDELGFIVKILEDDELAYLFPEKTIEERNRFKYYAYYPRNNYLGIFGS